MRRGLYLLCAVFGNSFAILIAILVSNGEYSVGAAASIFVWLALGYCSFRGQQWARWLAVLVLAALGLLAILIETGALLVGAFTGELEVDPESFAFLIGGVVLFVDAGVLAFSESVGDFMAWRNGVPVVENWKQAAVAVACDEQRRPINRLEILEDCRRRTLISRRARRVTVVAVVLGSIIVVAGLSALLVHSMQDLSQEIQATSPGDQPTDADRMIEAGKQAGLMGLPLLFVGGLQKGISSGLLFVLRIVVVLGALLLVGLLLLASYTALFIIPFLLTLPVVLPFSRGWRDPIRLLVLRPFNKDRITTQLTRFLAEQISPFGHCYTLSDRRVRVPLLVRIPLLLGALAFFNFRVRKIRRPQHIEKLVQAMRKRVRRNLNWCFSKHKLFPVTCGDPGWQACVGRLVQEVHVIVVDLSSITDNVAWELELLRDTGALPKTVFVAQESQSAQVHERMSQILGASSTAPPLLYGSERPASPDVVATRVLDALAYGASGSSG
jgi:hypothetical protein